MINYYLNTLILYVQQAYPWLSGITQGLIANEISQLLFNKKTVEHEEIDSIIKKAIIDIEVANISIDTLCNILANAGLIKINGTTIIANEILFSTASSSEIHMSNSKSQTSNSTIETKGNGFINLKGNGAKIHQDNNGITISTTGSDGSASMQATNGKSSAGFYIRKK